ncbi:MAG: nucleotidyltransferase domain-containing protein [Candidatus Binatia bacterium]
MSDIKKNPAKKAASGRFLLRLPSDLHDALRSEALAAGLSLNEWCCRRLAAPVGNALDADGSAAAVRWACELFGDRLLALVAYGSWARGEARRDSDVDLLVVLNPGSPITRDLYRRWDARESSIDGHEVEPHFVHPRGEDSACTGLWAEAALDGIVLFERAHDVSRSLAHVRRELVSGKLVRKTAHGQPYWAEVA